MSVLLVSQRIDEYPDRGERRDALDQALVQFISVAGYVAIPVPNSLVEADGLTVRPGRLPTDEILLKRNKTAKLLQFINSQNVSGIVLSGGNDIGTCSDRDITELVLLRFAMKHRLPVLGICRGMQMLGVFGGVELESVQGHIRTRHNLKGQFNHNVNSFHGLSLSKCPEGYLVIARSEDNQIEAMRSEKMAWEGWMWHPEREEIFNTIDIQSFRQVFKQTDELI